MTREEFEYLKSPEARQLIEDNISNDPVDVALRTRNHAIATQVKNLQKCKTKLPSYFAARCVIPTISYEQSSSELAAFSKTTTGVSEKDCIPGESELAAFSKTTTDVSKKDCIPGESESAAFSKTTTGVSEKDCIPGESELAAFSKTTTDVSEKDCIPGESELAVFSKTTTGLSALDLTCGLGVDSFALSKRYEKVTTVEADALRADIARWNFERMNIDNIEVVNCLAEEYLEKCDGVDLIYIDPDRRSDSGRSVYAIEQCRPNVLQLLPLLKSKSPKIVIKLSPLFDVEESYRLFGDDVHCEVVTVNNECREVLIKIGFVEKYNLSVNVIRSGIVENFQFLRDDIGDRSCDPDLTPRYICVPDVGFYKTRTISALMKEQKYYYSGGYVITEELPLSFCGEVCEIQEMIPYQPKVLRKRFKQAILRLKNFPYTVEQIGIPQGGTKQLFFTVYKGKNMVFVI